MNVKHVVELDGDERQMLQNFVSSGCSKVRDVKRAQILLAADRGCTDAKIAETVSVGTSTVFRTKRRFVTYGIQRAIHDDPRPGAGRKLTGREEALLFATACSSPPLGRARWTLELLAERVVQLTGHDSLSTETIRRRLRDKEIKPWQKSMWCIPKVNAEYVARMEDILDLYAEDAPEDDPVVCFDESPVQLVGETRTPIPAAPGRPARVDYEYRRNGTANLFVYLDAHRPWRHVDVTEHRKNSDFAQCMKDLVDKHYPNAKRIRVVVDNLSTHRMAALYSTFEPEEARRIASKIEFHFVPVHASWLNMVEIEIGVIRKQCLDRRIEDIASLRVELYAWERARNKSGAKVKWLFNVEDARDKMKHAYPDLAVPAESSSEKGRRVSAA